MHCIAYLTDTVAFGPATQLDFKNKTVDLHLSLPPPLALLRYVSFSKTQPCPTLKNCRQPAKLGKVHLLIVNNMGYMSPEILGVFSEKKSSEAAAYTTYFSGSVIGFHNGAWF